MLKPPNVSEGPVSESDFFTWEALIMGPKDTPFEGGVFAAKLTFVSTTYCCCVAIYTSIVRLLTLSLLCSAGVCMNQRTIAL